EHVVEVVAVDGDDLAVLEGLEGLLRLAGQVGQDADDERQLDLLHGAVGFHVVGDLHAGPPDAVQFVLQALGHGYSLCEKELVRRVGGTGQDPPPGFSPSFVMVLPRQCKRIGYASSAARGAAFSTTGTAGSAAGGGSRAFIPP